MKVQGTAVSLTVQIFMGLFCVCRKKNLSSACFHLPMETVSVTHISHKKKKENKIHTHQSGVSQVLPGVPLFLMSLTKLPTSEHSLGVPSRCGFYYLPHIWMRQFYSTFTVSHLNHMQTKCL